MQSAAPSIAPSADAKQDYNVLAAESYDKSIDYKVGTDDERALLARQAVLYATRALIQKTATAKTYFILGQNAKDIHRRNLYMPLAVVEREIAEAYFLEAKKGGLDDAASRLVDLYSYSRSQADYSKIDNLLNDYVLLESKDVAAKLALSAARQCTPNSQIAMYFYVFAAKQGKVNEAVNGILSNVGDLDGFHLPEDQTERVLMSCVDVLQLQNPVDKESLKKVVMVALEKGRQYLNSGEIVPGVISALTFAMEQNVDAGDDQKAWFILKLYFERNCHQAAILTQLLLFGDKLVAKQSPYAVSAYEVAANYGESPAVQAKAYEAAFDAVVRLEVKPYESSHVWTNLSVAARSEEKQEMVAASSNYVFAHQYANKAAFRRFIFKKLEALHAKDQKDLSQEAKSQLSADMAGCLEREADTYLAESNLVSAKIYWQRAIGYALDAKNQVMSSNIKALAVEKEFAFLAKDNMSPAEKIAALEPLAKEYPPAQLKVVDLMLAEAAEQKKSEVELGKVVEQCMSRIHQALAIALAIALETNHVEHLINALEKWKELRQKYNATQVNCDADVARGLLLLDTHKKALYEYHSLLDLSGNLALRDDLEKSLAQKGLLQDEKSVYVRNIKEVIVPARAFEGVQWAMKHQHDACAGEESKLLWRLRLAVLHPAQYPAKAQFGRDQGLLEKIALTLKGHKALHLDKDILKAAYKLLHEKRPRTALNANRLLNDANPEDRKLLQDLRAAMSKEGLQVERLEIEIDKDLKGDAESERRASSVALLGVFADDAKLQPAAGAGRGMAPVPMTALKPGSGAAAK